MKPEGLVKKFFLLLFISTAVSAVYCGSLPFPAGVNSKNDDFYYFSVSGNKSGSINPLQTHSGDIVMSFSPEGERLYNYYLEKYRSPEWIMWLKTVTDRASLYIDFIDRELVENSMPPELLYLPVTESAYKSHAVSVSRAAGLWQFMTNSIAPFDIRVNEWVDERRDFWKATEGAVSKLRYNYSVLGDWLLAIAAYNCGLGRMQRTIAASGIRDFWELSEKGLLPRETAHYIPRFLAISRIMMYSGRERVSDSWENPVRWERILLKDSVSVSKLAEKASIPFDIIKKANPELNYDITPPGRYSYYLKVPEGKGDDIASALSDDTNSLMRFYFYTVKKGDTLYDLSRHYGVSVSMIRSYNSSLDPSRLMINQKILIPAVKKTGYYQGKDVKKADLDSASIYIASYTVKTGDTLWDIARRHGTDPYNVAYHNKIDMNSVLSIGMKLKVPAPVN